MPPQDWKLRLERFFFDQATKVDGGVPTLLDHCMVSGKEPRLSGQPEMHRDLILSIEKGLVLSASSIVLEVGCASGYVACGLAPRVAAYTGVDMSALPLELARRMNLANATFLEAHGEALPFDDASFDAVLANDVVQNLPTFDDALPLIREMLRVVRPGGRVMLGSVADASKAEGYQNRVREYSQWLTSKYGPVSPPKASKRVTRANRGAGISAPDVPAEATFYYCDYGNFLRLGELEGVGVRIEDVHPLNPYVGFRHNVVFTKP